MAKNEDMAADPFFGGLENTEWNACIGTQATEENYVDGYIEAAIELASAVIDKNLVGSRDTLAMPILYNARHGLELSLKYAIGQLVDQGVLPSRHEVNHDVMSHWRLLDRAQLGDEALCKIVRALGPFVTSLAQIDDDGQALRYPEDREGNKSLEDRSLANIVRMRNGVTIMGKILEQMKYRIKDLGEERATGSYTAECSRKDLLAIADMLPPASEWGEAPFLVAKAAVMERFSIGSRKFSAAADVIKKSPEMRLKIGLQSDLAYLTDAHAVFAIEQWALRHPPKAPGNPLGLDYFASRAQLRTMLDRTEVAGPVNDAIIATLSPDEIADLATIFQIGREKWFGEHYAEDLERTRKRHALGDSLWEPVNYLTEKTNLRDAVVRGMTILGRPDLAATIAAIPQ